MRIIRIECFMITLQSQTLNYSFYTTKWTPTSRKYHHPTLFPAPGAAKSAPAVSMRLHEKSHEKLTSTSSSSGTKKSFCVKLRKKKSLNDLIAFRTAARASAPRDIWPDFERQEMNTSRARPHLPTSPTVVTL